MKNTQQKGSVTLIVLIVILVIAAVGGYFYMQKNKAAPVATENTLTEGDPVSASATVLFEDGFTKN